jgi:hypothetical protein
MTDRELPEELEMQKKLEKWETEGVALRRDLNQARRVRKQLEMENDIELDSLRLRYDVSRLEQELEFTKCLNDQCRKHDKAMQDLKDIQCAEWKRVAEEAQKQLQSAQTAFLQVLMQNRADDTARKSQEDLAKVQLEFMNRLNERVNMNTNASQDMPDKHGKEQKTVTDVKELKKKWQSSLAPLTASTCNSRVVSTSPMGVDAAAFCLITPPIAPGIDKLEMAVASVKFTLQSHDQGWLKDVVDIVGFKKGSSSSLPSKQQVEYPSGTYVGSQTWFQVAIIHDSNPDLATMLLSMGTMSNDTLSRQADPNCIFYSEGWHIQHNISANARTRTHVVTWSGSSNTGINKGDANGWESGTGSGFLSVLVPGDRIAVIARAKVQKKLACFCCASINLLWR